MAVSLGRRFGDHVRALRGARGLTQERLAEASGLAPETIRGIERGAYSPTLETLAKLCDGLGVSLATLFHTFEQGRRDDVAELADFLATRTPREVRTVARLARALVAEDR